jgi:hypothetical protein
MFLFHWYIKELIMNFLFFDFFFKVKNDVIWIIADTNQLAAASVLIILFFINESLFYFTF